MAYSGIQLYSIIRLIDAGGFAASGLVVDMPVLDTLSGLTWRGKYLSWRGHTLEWVGA